MSTVATGAPLTSGPARGADDRALARAPRVTEVTAEPEARDSSYYARVLRLRTLHLRSWQRALFVEGAVALAILIVLADLASAWLILVFPVVLAVVVKFNDVVCGLLKSTPDAPTVDPPAPAPAAFDGLVGSAWTTASPAPKVAAERSAPAPRPDVALPERARIEDRPGRVRTDAAAVTPQATSQDGLRRPRAIVGRPTIAAPKIQLARAAGPNTSVPKTEMSRTEVPRTELLRTEVPRTEVPRTEVPRTAVARTELPRTGVPKIEVPQTVPAPPRHQEAEHAVPRIVLAPPPVARPRDVPAAPKRIIPARVDPVPVRRG
jgi:hypothetical protein